MKCSSGSTANNQRAIILAFAGILALGGCTAARHQSVVTPPVHGYADLDMLVRRHPGWAGVARYDLALTRLDNAANRSLVNAPADQTLATLPSISTEPESLPALSLAADQRRLIEVDRLQVARLRDRQAQSRERLLLVDREVWLRQAQAQFVQAARAAQAEYLQRVQESADDRTARRVNLTLQIKSLEKIVTGWNASIPPTPVLDQAKTDKVQKQAELASLLQAQNEAASQALLLRKAAIVQAQNARTAFVAELSDREEARLKQKDQGQVAVLEQRLLEERVALLRQEQSPPNSPAPAAGILEAQTLPAGPVILTPAPGATVRSLRASEANLRAQRERWVAFLYDDTRVAVLDIAGQHHWKITFKRSSASDVDMTEPLGQALTVSVWKSAGLL